MRTYLTIAAVAVAAMAVPANAVPVITSAAVTGPSGTVWNTTVDGYYTLFIQHPYGNTLNPNDNFSSAPIGATGASDYQIAGDGWPLGVRTGNSDPFYDLTLILTENSVSKTLSGVFDEATQTFTAVNGVVNFSGVNYTLTDFNWVRGLSNIVGSYSVGSAVYNGQPIGSKSDYQGAFTIDAANAVPEPATWALMILGFGAVGGVMRRRRDVTASAAA